MTAQDKIKNYLGNHKLVHGVGDKEAACAIASINIALTGQVTDERPECMCPVLHSWIIPINDTLPPTRLNGRFKALLPLAVGTNDGREKERLEIILDWMWGIVLPQLQPIADANGFGAEWLYMLREKSEDTACAAYAAVYAARTTYAASEYAAAYAAAYAAEYAAATYATRAAARAAAARAATYAAYAARAAAQAAQAAAASASYAHVGNYWDTIDVEGVLDRLINLPEVK